MFSMVIKVLIAKWVTAISKHTSLKLFTGTSTFIEALTTNGTNIQTSVAGVTASKRRFIDERRDQPFDKRLRFSVRQTESAYRYRDIVVRKQDGFTHILLSTKSSENNSLNPEVRTMWLLCSIMIMLLSLKVSLVNEESPVAQEDRAIFINHTFLFLKPPENLFLSISKLPGMFR